MPRPTSSTDTLAVHTYLKDDLTVESIRELMPNISMSRIYHIHRNLDAFRQLTVPNKPRRKTGPAPFMTIEMMEDLLELASIRPDV